MTTKLEQEFFKVFGIEKNNDNCPMLDKSNCIFVPSECNYYQYPEITDHRLLKMICILGNGKDGSKNLNLYTANEDEWFAVLKDQYNLAYCAAIDNDFKNAILKLCIYRADINDFKHQIQQLFKGEE